MIGMFLEAHIIVEAGKNGYKDQNKPDKFRKTGSEDDALSKPAETTADPKGRVQVAHTISNATAA
jgi:hypothetical protein